MQPDLPEDVANEFDLLYMTSDLQPSRSVCWRTHLVPAVSPWHGSVEYAPPFPVSEGLFQPTAYVKSFNMIE